ncbi:tRNA preQ1(34) S-adenosylmethionine ribosyltransferase-isomerase QueA [Sphingomonas bacterium]|uniref:tRNA preQ1(34) S-adenosylmethionine ribosyltransferase-isomerase QueA n=1 Tax=Sphingomonas bacterium TaxID=1895847 RepID=UPI001576B115|nr:tRNA preQ1(34) S-adenosylmethionine ribosyltransferase-isomerase QueA [Sphingomonas bacterium]
MRVDRFDFALPPECIALRPASPRDAARLLVLEGEGTRDAHVRDLPGLLRAGDCLIFNDTRVIPAQLEGRRGDARIGATLHKREGPRTWVAFVRNAKRVRIGDRIDFGEGVSAIAEERRDDGALLLSFEGDEPVELLLARVGRMPLPPYIAARRPADARDASDYQTMFAAEPGAVAAPTAALHFTPALIEALAAMGIAHETLTLHVGAGTFLPVKAEDTADHRMHAEWGRIDPATATRLDAVRAGGGRLIAVGTTSLRLIESACDEHGHIRPFEGDTAIFITPGYRFKGIDGLLTNFHLPRSTLFMLVSALMGLDRMKAAYAYAIENTYRFYSYGDASLLLP